MLKISGLSISYGNRLILDHLQLDINRNTITALVGESGAGKTTLGLSIMGLTREASGEAKCSGSISIDGRDICRFSPAELRDMRLNRVSMVFQDVDKALNPAYTIFHQVNERLTANGCPEAEANQRTHQMLEKIGLPERCRLAHPHRLSIGERQRALIAMAFVGDPELVILDEPFSALDVISRRQLTPVLRELAQNRTLLLITHDLAAAAELAHHTSVLYGGRIVESAPTPLLTTQPAHPYTRGLIRSFPDMYRTKDLQGIKGHPSQVSTGCPFHPRCTQSIAVCAKKKPPVKTTAAGWLACHRGGIVPLLEVNGLKKSFNGETILKGVDLTLYEGETVALVGQSGAGKTTLSKLIFGQMQADAGDIKVEHKTVTKRDRDFFRRLQVIYQDAREALSHRLNIFDAVKEPLDIQKEGSKTERMERVISVLKEVELPTDHDYLHRYPHQLSGGEVQRVVIARALVLNPKILIADEPTSALDCSVQAKILNMLNRIQEARGLSILFITHDIALARKVSDRTAVLHCGEIVESGLTGRVLAAPTHPHTRDLAAAAPVLSYLGGIN